MTDIFREVEEDVRRERFEKLWKEYGHYAIAAAVVLVLGVAGYQFWQRHEQSQRERDSAAYSEAMQLADTGHPLDAASKLGELAANGTSGYRELAKLAQGDALMSGGKLQDAVNVYKEVAEDKRGDELADVARIRAAWILVEGAPQAEVKNILAPLLGDDNAWRFMAREILAYSEYIAKQPDAALTAYKKLSEDAGAPSGVRGRAKVMSQFLSSGAGTDYGTVPPLPKPPVPAAAATAGAPTPAPAGKP